MVFQSHVTNENYYISTTRVFMTTKLGRAVTYFERLLTIKSFYALTTWSFKTNVTNKNHYMSTIRVPIATNLAE